jgi:hypothetical protein
MTPFASWAYDEQNAIPEDAFCVPPLPSNHPLSRPHSFKGPSDNDPQYVARLNIVGTPELILQGPTRCVGTFTTLADAQLAAEALNNHKGY